MSTLHRILGSILICATIIVLSVVGLASDFMTHLLSSLDGLLLLMICLMMAGIFSLMLFVLAKEAGMFDRKHAPAGSASAVVVSPAGAARAQVSDEVQPNQATHPISQKAAPAPAVVRPPVAAKSPVAPAAPVPPPAKLGEEK